MFGVECPKHPPEKFAPGFPHVLQRYGRLIRPATAFGGVRRSKTSSPPRTNCQLRARAFQRVRSTGAIRRDFRFLGNVFRTAQGVLPDTQALQHAPLSSRAEDSMPLDVLEADLVGLGSNSVGRGAPRYLDAQRLKFDLIVKVLPRDDPLRRS